MSSDETLIGYYIGMEMVKDKLYEALYYITVFQECFLLTIGTVYTLVAGYLYIAGTAFIRYIYVRSSLSSADIQV